MVAIKNDFETTNAVASDKHNATNYPDTPMEMIVKYLVEAKSATGLDETKALVQKALDVAGGLDEYIDTMTTPPPQACAELLEESQRHDWVGAYEANKTMYKLKKEMSAGMLEGRFMKMLCHMTRAKRVLEVGMFTGTSTMAMAEAIPPGGKIVALELEQYCKDFTAPHFQKAGFGDTIEVMVGPAAESMKKLKSQKIELFDLVFIDADKGGYKEYYTHALDLITPDGIIAVDNTLMKGRPYIPYELKDCELSIAIQDFNEFIMADPRVEIITLPFRDGVTIIRKKRPSPVGQDCIFTGMNDLRILERMSLQGKAALITGGGQGIGRAFAHALGEAGARVAIVDMNKEKAQEVSDELKSKGILSTAIQANVAVEKDIQEMVDTCVKELGGLDIAINNAGINKNSAAEDTPMSEYDMTFSVNTRGVFMCCQAEGRYMMKNGGGTIINTASMATLLVPHPQKQLVYNCSKAAVVKMTQTLACEWADRNIRVNCISPGIVNTALIQESKDLQPLVGEWLKQIPLNRLAEVSDLQSAIVFMASDSSAYMTGHNLVIEGGQSLW